jgi:hypothetical protein
MNLYNSPSWPKFLAEAEGVRSGRLKLALCLGNTSRRDLHADAHQYECSSCKGVLPGSLINQSAVSVVNQKHSLPFYLFSLTR